MNKIPNVHHVHHVNQFNYLAVEDPFETFVNVGRNCNLDLSKMLATEFRRAFAVMTKKEGVPWLFFSPVIDPPGVKKHYSFKDL